MDYEVGKRYPMTREDALPIVKNLQFIISSQPDYSRGRVFDKKPCNWHFWTVQGKRIEFSFQPGMHFIGSESREIDPELPEPLQP